MNRDHLRCCRLQDDYLRYTQPFSAFFHLKTRKTVVDISFVYVPEIADDLPSLSVYLYIVTDTISSDAVQGKLLPILLLIYRVRSPLLASNRSPSSTISSFAVYKRVSIDCDVTQPCVQILPPFYPFHPPLIQGKLHFIAPYNND